MESSKIERLLDAYFEGASTLEEEAVLHKYFAGDEVASHLQQYKPLFRALTIAKKEMAPKPIALPNERKPFLSRTAIAAIAAVLVGIGVFFLSKPSLTIEEREALEAFEKSRESMMFLSERFNFGAQQLQYVDEFKEAKKKVFEDEKEDNQDQNVTK
ncbi:MAG TPA: hypothetical protein VFF21_03760 [Flavobacteriaceae bacterium]|nr:hypothetical protein [Flavobacteriaceae bacterium]